MNDRGSIWDVPIGFAIYAGIIAASIGLALLPGLIAFSRRAHDRWFILALNLFLGATGVGWVVALAWACRARPMDDARRAGRAGGVGLDLLMEDVRRLPVFPQSQEEAPPPATTTAYSVEQVTDGVERLSALERDGYLTAEEFQILKARVIRGNDRA